MKQMRIILVLVFISVGAFAQGDKKDKMEKQHKTHKMSADIDNEAHAMMYADKMTTRLNLSLEQKEQIKQAQMKRLESQKEMMAEMMNESGNRGSDNAEMKEERMKIQEDFKGEMKDILTSEQYKKWEPMHERDMKMHGKMKNKEKNNNLNKDKDDSDY
ncbi:hypothetical protein [Christiangramia sediminis]|uniref:Uncharacterized protein n=1 Tax=Christiangramia sediminis TaxID=2881336 RepID=A0A9X1RW68_9FLAO|nr:hypothetical protein [Christiangramia sediminis]MCB7481488.1 hypothetical protein [Christiangramia sediminis]